MYAKQFPGDVLLIQLSGLCTSIDIYRTPLALRQCTVLLGSGVY